MSLRHVVASGVVCLLPWCTADAQVAALPDSVLTRILSDNAPRLMKALGVPGGVLVVVRGSHVLLNVPIGVSNTASGAPVSADSTTFRIASVAKIFTSLATLQLQASGAIQFDQDVRPLITDIAVGDRVLTMRDLLTHTAGFEEQSIGYLSHDTTSPIPLARVLQRSMPPRTRNDENTPGYSNMGYALAGLVVERVSGMPFDRYVSEKILQPLGMRSTAFVIPPMPALTTRLASEYRSTGERRVFAYSPSYPAGNIATTGADMARLLQVLVRGDAMILPVGRNSLFAGPALVYHPELPAMGLGLSGQRLGGHLMWIKGGASPSHSAVIALIPDLELGLFLAVNRQEPLVWDRLLQLLGDSIHSRSPDVAEHEAVPTPDNAVPTPNEAIPTSNLAADGDYRWTRTPLSSVEKLGGLFAQVRLWRTGDTLHIMGPQLGGRWVRNGRERYLRSDGNELALRTDANGRVTHVLSIVQGQPVSFDRIPLIQTTRFQTGTALIGTALVLLGGIAAARVRNRAGGGIGPWDRLSMMAMPVAELATAVSVVVLARQGEQLAFGPIPALRVALVMSTVMAGAALAQSIAGGRLTANTGLGAGGRVTFGVSAVGGIALLGLLWSNNLIGFHY
jgi:CubicO group peptidase (beta-lactamase class C family)